jgi:hypothetical protein
MGNAQAGGSIAQCCCESRTDAAGMQSTVLLAKPPVKEAENLYGVGLVFRTTRDGKMVVSSFVKDSSAYECGLVRDGGSSVRPRRARASRALRERAHGGSARAAGPAGPARGRGGVARGSWVSDGHALVFVPVHAAPPAALSVTLSLSLSLSLSLFLFLLPSSCALALSLRVRACAGGVGLRVSRGARYPLRGAGAKRRHAAHGGHPPAVAG